MINVWCSARLTSIPARGNSIGKITHFSRTTPPFHGWYGCYKTGVLPHFANPVGWFCPEMASTKCGESHPSYGFPRLGTGSNHNRLNRKNTIYSPFKWAIQFLKILTEIVFVKLCRLYWLAMSSKHFTSGIFESLSRNLCDDFLDETDRVAMDPK